MLAVVSTLFLTYAEFVLPTVMSLLDQCHADAGDATPRRATIANNAKILFIFIFQLTLDNFLDILLSLKGKQKKPIYRPLEL